MVKIKKNLSLRKSYFQKIVSLTVKIYFRIKVEQLDTVLFAIPTINDDFFWQVFFYRSHSHTNYVVETLQNTTYEGEVWSVYAIIMAYYITRIEIHIVFLP